MLHNPPPNVILVIFFTQIKEMKHSNWLHLWPVSRLPCAMPSSVAEVWLCAALIKRTHSQSQ